jgi:hypothetical protein
MMAVCRKHRVLLPRERRESREIKQKNYDMNTYCPDIPDVKPPAPKKLVNIHWFPEG